MTQLAPFVKYPLANVTTSASNPHRGIKRATGERYRSDNLEAAFRGCSEADGDHRFLLRLSANSAQIEASKRAVPIPLRPTDRTPAM